MCYCWVGERDRKYDSALLIHSHLLRDPGHQICSKIQIWLLGGDPDLICREKNPKNHVTKFSTYNITLTMQKQNYEVNPITKNISFRSLIKVKFSTDKVRRALGSGGCLFCLFVWLTRSYAALRAVDQDWIVGLGYSWGGYILRCSQLLALCIRHSARIGAGSQLTLGQEKAKTSLMPGYNWPRGRNKQKCH